MSKKKLIELIKMSDDDLDYWLENVKVEDARTIFRIALKEQARDIRHGCAEAVISYPDWSHIDCSDGTAIMNTVLKSKAHDACMNYRDKDLEGL